MCRFFLILNASRLNDKIGGIILMHDCEYDEPEYSLRETQTIVPALKELGYVFVSPTLHFAPVVRNLCENVADFSDAYEWTSDIGYYGTFRIADVNGDGMADIVARGNRGIYVALSKGQSFAPSVLWDSVNYRDDNGWLPEYYSTTLQCGDVDGDGKADLVARGRLGIYLSLSTGHSFGPSILKSTFFSDSNGWSSDVTRYGTIRLADVDGDCRADIVARDSDGIYVARSILDSEGVSFDSAVQWSSFDFSDANGWGEPQYAVTFQCADVDGDGKADIVARGAQGIRVALSTGQSWPIRTLDSGI